MGKIIQFPGAKAQPKSTTNIEVDLEVDWKPLEQFFGDAKAPELDGFTFMGSIPHKNGVGRISSYKHVDTRRYLHLDAKGNSYVYLGTKYVKISRQKALQDVYDLIDKVYLSSRGSLPRHEIYPCRRNSLRAVQNQSSA